jgi:CheY-like chemotaxis protein
MKLLLVEDEDSTISTLADAAKESGVDLIVGKDALQEKFSEEDPLESQLLTRFLTLQRETNFDLVLLDTNLSRMKNGLSASACRQALQEAGFPVCRYSKRQSTGQQTRFHDLRRLAIEGASAINVRNEILDGPQERLMPWLNAVHDGFAWIRERLLKVSPDMVRKLGPAGLLANLVERPEATSDFLGYTSQSLQFFGPAFESETSKQESIAKTTAATRLGYWLYNSILMFPGPLLHLPAASAYLNLFHQDVSSSPALLGAIAPAKYVGAFAKVQDYYWRADLERIVDGLEGDILNSPLLKNASFKRVDEKNPQAVAYWCVISEKESGLAAVASNPDWIPAGAQVARIRREIFEKLSPMLSS